jgi:hypothetical protein
MAHILSVQNGNTRHILCTKIALLSYRGLGLGMRFYFNLSDDEGLIPDEEGSELADLESARAEARADARELAIEDMRNGNCPRAWRIQISDSTGTVVESVQLEVAMTSDDALSAAQFASLTEIGRTFLHDPIPSGDAALLLERGLIYRLLGSLRITAAGRTRLSLGS